MKADNPAHALDGGIHVLFDTARARPAARDVRRYTRHTMTAFEVYLNGKKICTAGVGEAGVLSTSLAMRPDCLYGDPPGGFPRLAALDRPRHSPPDIHKGGEEMAYGALTAPNGGCVPF